MVDNTASIARYVFAHVVSKSRGLPEYAVEGRVVCDMLWGANLWESSGIGVAIYKDTDYMINTMCTYHFFPHQLHLCVTTKPVFTKLVHLTLPLSTVVACLFSLLFLFYFFPLLLFASWSWDLALEFYFQLPFQIFYNTRWPGGHLHEQKTALFSRCETVESLNIRAEQKIVSGWSAWVCVLPAFCILFCYILFYHFKIILLIISHSSIKMSLYYLIMTLIYFPMFLSFNF